MDTCNSDKTLVYELKIDIFTELWTSAIGKVDPFSHSVIISEYWCKVLGSALKRPLFLFQKLP